MDPSTATSKPAALTVKLTSHQGVTRRVKEAPESFQALQDAVKAQILKKQPNLEFAVTYEDDQGDTINVSDDEDLTAAYDVAREHLKGRIKFHVRPRET